MAPTALVEEDRVTTGVCYFDPKDYVVHLLNRAIIHGQDVTVSAEGIGEVLVLGSRGEYIPDATSLEAFCTVPAHRFTVNVHKPGGLPTAVTGRRGRSIDELQWQAAFYASNGCLMAGCHEDDVVELTHWPNLSRLPHTPNAVRIAALLTRHPTSIMLASRLLKVGCEELYQLYSAARNAGIARAVNRKAEAPVLPPHRNQTLLSSLLGKIVRL